MRLCRRPTRKAFGFPARLLFDERLRLREAQPRDFLIRHGKAEPYRHVLRQSRIYYVHRTNTS